MDIVKQHIPPEFAVVDEVVRAHVPEFAARGFTLMDVTVDGPPPSIFFRFSNDRAGLLLDVSSFLARASPRRGFNASISTPDNRKLNVGDYLVRHGRSDDARLFHEQRKLEPPIEDFWRLAVGAAGVARLKRKTNGNGACQCRRAPPRGKSNHATPAKDIAWLLVPRVRPGNALCEAPASLRSAAGCHCWLARQCPGEVCPLTRSATSALPCSTSSASRLCTSDSASSRRTSTP